ncbi:MAG TPA: alpha/beta fold hydrolase [Frankiaceae bacterium]|nr:alpha/beta fold hydrolase [Frankiaceae bacterium]
MRDEHPLPGTDHVVDGVRLHVVHHGSGDGLPVLLLHGIPTSSYLWRDVQRDLEHRHRTYAPDLVGLGGSERPASVRYDFQTQASLLLALADDLGLDRFAVAGHDVGGGVAVHLTAMARERVAALVLVDAPLHADVWPVAQVRLLGAPLLGEAQTAAMRLVPGGTEYLLRTALARGLRASELSAKVLAHYAAPFATAAGGRGMVELIRAFDPQATEAAFALVAADAPPSLVLWAEEDAYLSPAIGRRVAGELPGASYVEIGGAGHFLPEDRPERVAEEIAAFLADV